MSTKIHQLVDGNGLPIVTLITPGQAGDSPMFLPLMARLRVGRETGRPRTRPDAVRGGKAYWLIPVLTALIVVGCRYVTALRRG